MADKQQGLINEVSEQERARIAGQSVEANLAESREALAEYNKELSAVPYNKEHECYEFNKLEGEKSAGEVKEKLANLRGKVQAAIETNVDKLEAKSMREFAGTQLEDRQTMVARSERNGGAADADTFSAFMDRHYGDKVPSWEEVKGGKLSHTFKGFNWGDIQRHANVMTVGAGGGGIAQDVPRSLEQVVRALELRGGISNRLARYPMPNQSDTYKYLAEVESGIVHPTGIGSAENTAAVNYDPIAGERSQAVVKRAIFSAITKEQIEDVPQAMDYWNAQNMRLIGEDLEQQVLQGNGNGETNATANDLNGIAGSGTGNGRQGQVGTIGFNRAVNEEPGSVSNNTANERTYADFFIDALTKYMRPRNGASEALRGAGTMPNLFIMQHADWMRLNKQKDDEGEYLFADVLMGGVSQFFGIPIIKSDFCEADTAVFLNTDSENIGMIYQRQLDVQYGLEAGDLRAQRQSAVYTHRCNVVFKRPRTGMIMRNLKGTTFTA